MRRRDFIKGIAGSAVVWPLVARAQQPTVPVVGVLDPRLPGNVQDLLRVFRQGLKDTGYVEGENLALEYRWAENQMDRLPTLAADLVRRRVAVIAAISPAAAVAAKAATTTLPIVFLVNEDPVRRGLVASLAHPGGNLTGINILTVEVAAKRLDLLRELMPSATRVGVLVNPVNTSVTETTLSEVADAARPMGLQIKVVNASTSGEIETALQVLCANGPTSSSLLPTLISIPEGFSLPCWRRATRCPRRIHSVTLLRPAD